MKQDYLQTKDYHHNASGRMFSSSPGLFGVIEDFNCSPSRYERMFESEYLW